MLLHSRNKKEIYYDLPGNNKFLRITPTTYLKMLSQLYLRTIYYVHILQHRFAESTER